MTNNGGVIAGAARALECSPGTLRNRISQEPELRQVIHDARRNVSDACATRVIDRAIHQDNQKDQHFILDRWGWDDGWSRRDATSVSAEVDVNAGKLSVEILRLSSRDQGGGPPD